MMTGHDGRPMWGVAPDRLTGRLLLTSARGAHPTPTPTTSRGKRLEGAPPSLPPPEGGGGGTQVPEAYTLSKGPTPGEILAPSLGTHCEPNPKSGGGESRDRGAVTAPYPSILERWDISKGACFNIMALITGYEVFVTGKI